MPEYFSHDYDAREDERIIALLQKNGMEGYGLYWAIIEMLYKNGGYMRTHWDGIAYALRVESNLVKSIVTDYDLFAVNGDRFYSGSVLKRLRLREDKSQKARESANSRWNKQKKDANAMRTQSDSNAKKESKGNKEKKEIKKDNGARAFYSEQFLIGKGKEKFDAYCRFVGTIFNEKYLNEINKPVDHILKVPNQLSFEQYEKLAAEAKKRQVNIMDLLNVMINKPKYLKETKSLYLTLLNWIKREPIKGTNH